MTLESWWWKASAWGEGAVERRWVLGLKSIGIMVNWLGHTMYY